MKSWMMVGVIGLLALASCRKEEATPPFALPENTWLYGNTTLHGAYSDLVTKKGYQLIFYPAGMMALTQNISFQFTALPLSGNTYKPGKDTFTAGTVKIILQTDTTSAHYYSVGNDNTLIQATIKEGKLNLIGNNIRMQRDTIPALADTTTLSFNLTQF